MLFGTAGVRGPYPSKVSPKLIYDIALTSSYVIAKNKGSAVIGHDSRLTSPLLSLAASSGFMAGGLDAILIGVSPLPVVAFEVKKTRSSLGASISASHNPPADNGIKLFKKEGLELFRSEEAEIERSLGSFAEVEWNRAGAFTFESNANESYINEMLDRFDESAWRRRDRPKVLVDCANGAASSVTPKLLREMGLERILTINCNLDGTFPGRLPEPRPDVMRSIQPLLDSSDAEILLAHDGDADRLAILSKGVGFVKQDLIIALLARRVLRDHRGTVVVSVDVGYEVQEVVEKLGGKIIRAPLGRLHEYISGDVIMAAEPWKFIDPSWGLWPDGIYQAAAIVDEVMISGQTFNEMVYSLPSYPNARLSFRLSNDKDEEELFNVVSQNIEKALNSKVISIITIDGVRVEYDDNSWILVRASGTESKLRLYAQAVRPMRLKELVDNAKDIVLSAAGSLGIKVEGVEEAINMA